MSMNPPKAEAQERNYITLLQGCVLNQRKPGERCVSDEGSHLPKRLGGGRRDRTDDLMLAKHALSQLSYAPNLVGSLKQQKHAQRRGRRVGLGRLELPTSRLSSARSNQLSYKPEAVTSKQ